MNDEFKKLKTLEQQADAANNRMNSFQNDVAAAITDLAFHYFPELKDMDADDFRAFGKIISQHTWRLTADADKLHYQVRKGSG